MWPFWDDTNVAISGMTLRVLFLLQYNTDVNLLAEALLDNR